MFVFGFLLVAYFIAAFYDYKYRMIPNVAHIIIILAGLLNLLFYSFSLVNSVLSLIVIGGIALIYAVSTDNLGGGDVKLIGSTAFAIGYFPTLIILLVTFLVPLILSRLKVIEKKSIPLAPYFLAGYLVLLVLSILI